MSIKKTKVLISVLLCISVFGIQNDLVFSEETAKPKNIIFIMLDDAGFFDFSYNNDILENPDAMTPNVDKLREDGKAFTQFYSSSAVCSPTRSAVLTGSNPVRFGAVDAWPQIDRLVQINSGMSGLPRNAAQMGLIMNHLGKHTGHFGKWHVGLSRKRYSHKQLGFKEWSYHQNTPDSDSKSWSGPYEFNNNGIKSVVDVDHIDEYYTDRVIDFIKNTKQDGSDFYVNFWPLTPHYPRSPPRDFDYSQLGFDSDIDNLNNRERTVAMMYFIDQQIGRIVDTLKTEGLLDDTLIVVTSDNGNTSQAQNPEKWHRGNKGSLWEGGLRMPTIAHWPNGITPNTSNHSVMSSQDLMPTFIELLGYDTTKIEGVIDGKSKAQSFLTDTVQDHDPMYWQISGGALRPEVDETDISGPAYSYREGNYKIVKVEGRDPFTNPNAYFLFDVENDRQEKINLRNTEPELLNAMRAKLQEKRVQTSRVSLMPTETNGERTILKFDPRFDVNSKDMTFKFSLDVPKAKLDSYKILYYKPGTQVVVLTRNKKIIWRTVGVSTANKPTKVTLQSEILDPGTHEIILNIGGYKKGNSLFEMFIDSGSVDTHDPRNGDTEIRAAWSTVSAPRLGDEGIFLKDISYHTIKFWPEEFDDLRNY